MWNYKQPVEIQFGTGILNQLKDILEERNYDNGVIVCQDIFIENGTIDRLMRLGGNRIKGVFSAVDNNPTVINVDKCAEDIRKNNYGFVVALGGGSVLDCAKAAASVCQTEDSIEKYHGTGVSLPKERLPLIAMPTTSGTGSEVTCVSVLSNTETGKKMPINSDNFYPDLALVDPELTYSMPSYVTAFTGIDALCHALEGFWAKGHQSICDAMALHATDNVFKYLIRAYQQPHDALAREKMSEAAIIAGLAFTLPKTTASHAISFPLTTKFHIPHGAACGLTIDYFTRFNADERLHRFSRHLGFRDAYDMADAIQSLKKTLGLPCDLKQYHLTDQDVDDLVKMSEHPNLHNNPVEVTTDVLYDMFNSFR